MAETFGFQAEVKQLLHLMIHSLYSEREIFLRELVSNASDANDKLRFEALARMELLGEEPDLVVRVAIDEKAGLLSVSDNGIGMSRGEIIEQLGTVAHSGTSRYLERLTGDDRRDSKLIGQFGVGFYSSFIVADEVTVTSRKAGLPAAEGIQWRSDGKGEYSVESIERPERGTTVTLRLKDGAKEFLDADRVRALIRKYSDHIAFPIFVKSGEAEGDEPVNRAKALWTRSRTEIADEEYLEFYRHISHDFTAPVTWSHNRVEGKREYTSLLYIPAVAPVDLWNRETPHGIKLYVQRVFITDHASNFLPVYLRFVRGIVDCSDLSLNVSREMLQQDPAVASMRSALTKRVLDMLAKLARDEPEKYAGFWTEFGSALKEGLGEDPGNRGAIAELLRFDTTRSEGRSLRDYVGSAQAAQDRIYYLIAESVNVARSSPHLEAFRDRDIEVLLLTDRLDEWALQFLTEFDGKSFKDVGRGALELPAEQQAERMEVEPSKEHRDLLKRLKRVLRERVDEVRVSARLKESAACLVLNERDVSYQMGQLLKAAGHEVPASKPSLEINPAHPLLKRVAAEQDPGRFEEYSELVLDQAILAEGRQLEDPAGFVKRLNDLLLESED